ncbi:unnamed protein product [Rhizophagus irregularis]|nr:unnamed protein product [Rhizophagus irregularis]
MPVPKEKKGTPNFSDLKRNVKTFINYPLLIYLYSRSSPFQKKRPFLKNKNKKSTETAASKEETVPKEIRIRGPPKLIKSSPNSPFQRDNS